MAARAKVEDAPAVEAGPSLADNDSGPTAAAAEVETATGAAPQPRLAGEVPGYRKPSYATVTVGGALPPATATSGRPRLSIAAEDLPTDEALLEQWRRLVCRRIAETEAFVEAQHRAPDTPGPGPEEVGPDPSAIPQQQDDSSAPAEVDVQPLATEGKEGEATEAADEGPPDAPGDTTDVLADAGEAAEAASDAPVALNEVPEKRGDVAEELSAAPKEDPAEPDNEGEAVDHVDDPPQGTEEPPEWANTIVEEAAEVVEAADGDPKDDGERPELAEETYRE
eukprot:EG_transcript_19439